MRTLHLDCSLGVSGDMLLAALLGAHKDPQAALAGVQAVLDRLGMAGLRLVLTARKVAGIAVRGVRVHQATGQPLRHLADLCGVVRRACPEGPALEGSLAALEALARAEATVHDSAPESVHFHEVGAVDTVADILGTMLLVQGLKVRRVTASPVNLGGGFVHMAHGRHPAPPPAVAELAKGLKVFGSGEPETGMEMATPTGLALVRTLVQSQGPLPLGTLEAVGYGCGDRSSDERPTYLRAFVVQESDPEEIYQGGCAE